MASSKLRFYHIPKPFLLLVAGLVWLAAGGNILRLGLSAASQPWTVPYAFAAAGIFAAFFFLIFRRMVFKHTRRIAGYAQRRVHILRFFDIKSYCIMAFMMALGIFLRASHWLPGAYIRTFYTGLGGALLCAGLGFLPAFIRQLRSSGPAKEE